MDNKKHIAINTHLWLPIVMFVVFIAISICCIIENEIIMTVGFLIVALLPIFVFLKIGRASCRERVWLRV